MNENGVEKSKIDEREEGGKGGGTEVRERREVKEEVQR